ncbi:MAG: sulfatase-like hydrolase/transferase, partial [Planctomycetes bacterium]|nr:sulfatase-like hydrolase/transferase [Planctomycetota bacterium]
KVYREMIEVMDENVGRVVQAVSNAGLTEKTFIFFFSDNGPSHIGSTGPLRGKKGQIWEGGHRVPAIASWPGKIAPGKVSDVTAMGADLLPTLAALGGAPLPDGVTLDGINLLPHLLEAKPLPSRPLFWSVKKQLAIRLGNFKLITNDSFSDLSLYDLKTDPGEQQDIAIQRPETVQVFLQRLKAWHTEVNQGVKQRT